MKKLLMMIGVAAMPSRGALLYSMRTMIAVAAIAASAMLPFVASATTAMRAGDIAGSMANLSNYRAINGFCKTPFERSQDW